MKNIYLLGKKLFPICRSITGPGVRQTLKIIKKEIPQLKIKSIKSGTKVFDWKVPSEWLIKDAFVMYKNKKIIDFKKNNLHLVSYSKPINKILNKKDLYKKIYSIKNQPNAIPYVTSYYKKDWGFCLSENSLKKLNKIKDREKFLVKINSKFKKNGVLNYGEIYIKGKSKNEILISTYICHPSMANNELSGPLVSIALAKHYIKKKNNKSIRIIFVPETIGAISYINKNFNHLKKNVIGGYILTCIGDNKNYSYLSSKYNKSLSDTCARNAFKTLGIKYKNYSFLKRASDERQFNSPIIDLELGSIMRTKYSEFKEYHTSLDTFGKVVTLKGLTGGFTIAKKSIDNIQNYKITHKRLNTRKKSKKNPLSKFICEPQLGKRNLYPSLGIKNDKKIQQSRKLLNFLQYADGSNSIQSISKYIKLKLSETISISKILKKNKLI